MQVAYRNKHTENNCFRGRFAVEDGFRFMNSASPRGPSAAGCPIQKNAGVTRMESLRYKEFCSPFRIATSETHLQDAADRLDSQFHFDAAHDNTLKLGASRTYADCSSWKGTRRHCRRQLGYLLDRRRGRNSLLSRHRHPRTRRPLDL